MYSALLMGFPFRVVAIFFLFFFDELSALILSFCFWSFIFAIFQSSLKLALGDWSRYRSRISNIFEEWNMWDCVCLCSHRVYKSVMQYAKAIAIVICSKKSSNLFVATLTLLYVCFVLSRYLRSSEMFLMLFSCSIVRILEFRIPLGVSSIYFPFFLPLPFLSL